MDIQLEYVKAFRDKTRQYFIENYLETYNADLRQSVKFQLFPRQKAFLKSLVDNSNTIAIKHRQAGITTVSSAWITGQIVFASPKSPETVLCIGNKLDISEQLVEKIGAFLDQVPRWFWGPDFYHPDPDNPKNTKSIYKARNKQRIELFNGCKVYARSSGENAARGISAVSIQIFDEAAFIQNGISVYAQAVAATASVRDAKIIMVSTPNGKDHLYYRTYAKALKGENNYHPVEFKWFQDLRYNRYLTWHRKNPLTGVLEEDKDPVIGSRGEIHYDEERWRRLEREGWVPDSPWYSDMCKTFNNDERKIAQELNVSFLGSSDNVVSAEVIEAQLTQNVIQITDDWPLRDQFVKETWIWKNPIPGHRYILACDTSSGSGDDNTAIEVLDVDAIDENGIPCVEQVLEYYGKRTGDEIGEMIYEYGKAYNDALVVVEGIGGYGDATILTLLSMKYPNLYYDDPGLKTYTVQRAYNKFGVKNGDKLPGFRTSNMRVQQISNFVAMVKDNTFRIRSQRVITELETWIFKNGRPDHMDGCHDDSLLCLSMGLFVMSFSMLRHDKQKARDSKMLSSWFVNNQSFNKDTYHGDKNNVNICNPRQMPIYSSRQLEKKEMDKFNAMMLLGGVTKYKK